MTKRVVLWCSAALAALLVAVLIAVVVLIATINKQADDQAFRECVERLDPGYTSATGVEEYSEAMSRASEICSR